jgi:membrane-bound lytic murein transglycosylase MltF
MRLFTSALRAAATAVIVVALADVGVAERALEPESTTWPRYVPNPERVAVQVNGWIIEVDGVKVDTPEPARPRMPVVVRPSRPPAVLSRYDHLIQWHSASHGLDWRLVAALIQEESGFKSDAVSSKGAIGLMQVRAIAAQDVGEIDFSAPNDNIRTGVRYLKRLETMFASAGEGRDRLALVLAAYNVGPAHVQDAQGLARNYGFDPYRWDNSMARILPLLEDPAFYGRVTAGYAQGRAGVTYVERILSRYDRYRVQTGEAEGLADPQAQAASANG